MAYSLQAAEKAMNRPLIAIFGPTGVGKSALALRMALRFDGEIISADSRQVYQGMDIATDKPSPEEQAAVTHYLLDVVRPDEEYSLAQYQQMAHALIDDIQARGKVPFLVGGTALYLKAVVEGWQIPKIPPDPALRASLELRVEEEGIEPLYKELQTVDPEAARRILPTNSRRVIRALEVFYGSGIPISEQQKKSPPPYEVLKIGLTMPRPLLYQRIDARVDSMIDRGLVDEVKGLIDRGYGLELPSMSGLGYREIGQYLNGALTLDEAVQKIKFNTHRFVRHQYVWFRKEEEAVWIDMSEEGAADHAEGIMARFLAEQ